MKMNLLVALIIYFTLGSMITLVIVSTLFYKIYMSECYGGVSLEEGDGIESIDCNEILEDSDVHDDALARSIRNAFEVKRLHLNSDLTLNSLAAECGTNRTYLSEYFNRRLKKSFNEFVNDYRIVNESIPLIKKFPHMSIANISEMSGFGSVATFRRAFIRKTGMTPSEFKVMLRRKTMSGKQPCCDDTERSKNPHSG